MYLHLRSIQVKKRSVLFLLGVICILFSTKLIAQKPLNPIQDAGPKTKVELIRADSLVGENMITQTQTFLGNVIFKHNGIMLGCNKAIHNVSSNYIEAFGKIVINQGDTMTIVGDTLYYDGNLKYARVLGKSVVLRDKKVSLKTTKVNYDLNTGQAVYPEKGFLKQDSATLTSKEGKYNTRTKIFNYIGDVEILHPSYTICTDSLDYNAITKFADFKTFTTIKSKNGDISTSKGYYNLKSKVSKFQGRASVSNAEYVLEGDTLNYDNINDKGWARGKVVFLSFKDSLISTGNRADRNGLIGLTKMSGNTLSHRMSIDDTLLLKSDTLWIYEKIKNKEGQESGAAPTKEDLLKIVAKGKVASYKSDFQSVSDSMVYDYEHEEIDFFRKPILWNGQNQMEGDSIFIHTKNKLLDHMILKEECFVIQKDTLGNHNQIKGRYILAKFLEGKVIKSIYVEGNGESIYFALDESFKIIGLNKVQCGIMTFNFDNNKIDNIVFRTKPESVLIPPNEIAKEDLYLENFEWKLSRRPKPQDFMNTEQYKRIQAMLRRYFGGV
ncbi:MAG: OstA-like protein [Leadbetterella sp.]